MVHCLRYLVEHEIFCALLSHYRLIKVEVYIDSIEMNGAYFDVTRRKYILVGSAPASLLATVTSKYAPFITLRYSIYVRKHWPKPLKCHAHGDHN